MPNEAHVTVSLTEFQYEWLVEIVEYEIDYFKKLGSDRTEADNEQLERLQALETQLETPINRET